MFLQLLGVIASATINTAPARGWRGLRRARQVPQHRSIMVLDMAGSARWPNQQQLRARRVLREAVRDALRVAGIVLPDEAIEDRGDGLILLFPPKVSKVDLLDPLIPVLTDAIRAHNRTVPLVAQIQLRIAVHAGEVHRDAEGWVGTDLNLTCRLVNGKPLYRRLRRRPRPTVVLAVSEVIFQSVVSQRYRGINPAAYTRVRIRAKEADAQAWLHTPGLPRPASWPVRLLGNLRRRLGRRAAAGSRPALRLVSTGR